MKIENKMSFTELELNVLQQLASYHGEEFATEHDDRDGNPYPRIDMFMYAKEIDGDQKAIRGVLSSLLQKGAIEQVESEEGNGRFAWIFSLTHKAFTEIKEAA
tara:strand:+ start:3330 stop:3638 length:309 start_codon:yes stop_codon:yes gene_type:complete